MNGIIGAWHAFFSDEFEIRNRRSSARDFNDVGAKFSAEAENKIIDGEIPTRAAMARTQGILIDARALTASGPFVADGAIIYLFILCGPRPEMNPARREKIRAPSQAKQGAIVQYPRSRAADPSACQVDDEIRSLPSRLPLFRVAHGFFSVPTLYF